ncbi:MAG: HEAT repeat domain-containing protein, partial [Phycisphaerae bacterium]
MTLSAFSAHAQEQPETTTEPAQPAVEPPPAEPPAVEAPAEGTETAPAESAPAPQAGDWQRLADDFTNFLQFAIIGQFDMADGLAKSLLQHPDLNPMSEEGGKHLLELSEKNERSLETLLLLISNPRLGGNAKRILDLVNEAHRRARRDVGQIKENIRRLAGTPTERQFGRDQLIESGEYAVPWMLEALADPQRASLQPFILRALPQLGRQAVNPLVQALHLENDVIQRFAAGALGQIGYPQALPYLKRVAENEQENAAVRAAAVEAIGRIIVSDPGVKEAPAAELFLHLAEQYYAGVESVSPDPREADANVWYPAGNTVTFVPVPREIYNPVMAMRCCEDSLALRKDQPAAAALWLSADFRREAGLGLDVQSEEPAQTEDRTRPADFLRSIYFARSFGPDVVRLSLRRGLRDVDRNVALGAIAGLSVTAGPAAMTTPTGDGNAVLVEALAFPDLLVRIRAALAIGRSLPGEAFRGADDVVRVLAGGLALTGRKAYVVVDPEAAIRDPLAGELARQDASVVAGDRLEETLSRAARELTHVDGIFLASDLKAPHVIEALRALAAHPRFRLSPVIVYVKKSDNLIADRVASEDARVGTVFAVNGGGGNTPRQLAEALLNQYPRVAGKYGHAPLSPELSLSLALDAAATLRAMAVRQSPVFDLRAAEKALVDALAHPSEELRIACLRVLALLDSPGAQRAIAAVALAEDQSEPLRLSAFAALADSGRHFGSRLESPALQTLVKQTLSAANPVLRTSASQALGALNPPGTTAAERVCLTRVCKAGDSSRDPK